MGARLGSPHKGGVDLPGAGNPRTFHLLLGHSKIDRSVGCVGIEVGNAVEIAE
jgi:hypothetical protein